MYIMHILFCDLHQNKWLILPENDTLMVRRKGHIFQKNMYEQKYSRNVNKEVFKK